MTFERIATDPDVIGGLPRIRGLRIREATVVAMVADGMSVDDNLSPVLAEILRAAGHDVRHVREVGLQAVADELVLAEAQAEQRVVVSADTDFGALLSRSGAKLPSVLLIRRLGAYEEDGGEAGAVRA